MARYPIHIADASVYVGTYRKYNEGSLFGKWLNLNDFTSRGEFYEACAQLHRDEEDAEYMFQDYENVPESLIDESWISENVFEVLYELSLLWENDLEAFLLWCDNDHIDLSKENITDLITDFRDHYIGTYDCEEDFAFELVEEREDLSDFAKQYFDYRAYANDLFCSDYWYRDGHVFYN